MVRPLREVFPELPHHVRQRGVRKNATFHEDSDYLLYIRALRDACIEFVVKIWAYVLMTNHVHLIAVPKEKDSISNALQKAHTSYATYFNQKYGFVGHLWQSRPKMSVMDDSYARNAIRYVERNPVGAGMVQRAEEYLMVECSRALWTKRRSTPLTQSLCGRNHRLVFVACSRPVTRRVTRNSAPSIIRVAMVCSGNANTA